VVLLVAVAGVVRVPALVSPGSASLKNLLFVPYSSYVVDERVLDAFPDASYGVVFGAVVAVVSGTDAYYS
jgi:hypothetical protein